MLVGRSDNVGTVGRLLDADTPAVVTGEAGIGKTALLRAVGAASGRTVFEGGGLASTSWLTHLPLRRAFGTDLAGDPEAVAAEVERRVGPGVLIVDDVHWADRPTLDCLALLAGRIGLLTGVRLGDPGADAVLDGLDRAGFVTHRLSPLGADDAAELVTGLRPDLPAVDVTRLVGRTGGNPLLLAELAATGEPSASLVLALEARLRGLDDDARDLFDLVALAGRPVRRAGLDPATLDRLRHVGLLVDTVGHDDEIAVRHALIGEVAVEAMAAQREVAGHARLARMVRDRGEAAVHHRLAGEPALAHAAALEAADAASAAGRAGERARHLALAAATATGPRADAFRLRAAQALEDAHDWDGLLDVLAGLDPADVDAQAVAALHRARGAWSAGDAEGLRHHLDAGLALVSGSGSSVETRLRIERTRVPIFVEGDYARAVVEGTAALAAAEATGTDLPRAHYLLGTALVASAQPGGADQLQAAIDGARAAGDTSTEFLAANNLVTWHESWGDQPTGRALAAEFARRADALGLAGWAQVFRVAGLEFAFHAGEYATVIDDAEPLLLVVREARARDQLVELLCLALVDVGRIDEAVRRVDAAAMTDDYRGTMQGLLVRMEAALWGGRPAQALPLAERYLAALDADVNTPLGEVTRAWARFDLGDAPAAPPPEPSTPMLTGVTAEVEGVGLLHAGDDTAAEAAFHRAAVQWAPWHRRGDLRCRWAAAEAARRAGRTDDAVTALESLEAELRARSMLPLLGRVHQSLRLAGRHRAAPRTHTSQSTLTGRQREILDLVAGGLTNGEIAQRLSISRYTVVTQLASASAKLGASTRAQAAALAVAGT